MVLNVIAKSPEGVPAVAVEIEFADQITGQSWSRYTDGNGYANINCPGVPAGRPFTVKAGNGWRLADSQQYFTSGGSPQQDVSLQVTPTFNNPAHWSLDQLCTVRGALWTARLAIPYGPRPDQPSNINALDYLESYDPATRQRMLKAYRGQGLTHAADGPMLDAGYHGLYPEVDFRGQPDAYFRVMREKWAAGVCPVHFAFPDVYLQREDPIGDFIREFEPIYRSAAAQALIKFWVPGGWERGYEFTSDMWVRLLQWARGVLPNALVGLHLAADQDAPTGGDDYKIPGWTNGRAWQAVAPYTHVWFVQNGGYVNSGNPVPSPEFIKNFTDQFRQDVRGSLANRFYTGYPGDWATTSAFGDRPILLVAGEYASYVDFWHDYPEIYAQQLGDAAIMAGAKGAFDGCLLPSA
jgi:hypothetical protein